MTLTLVLSGLNKNVISSLSEFNDNNPGADNQQKRAFIASVVTDDLLKRVSSKEELV